MFSSGWARGCYTPKNLPDYSFIIKGKVGRKRISLSFLSRCPASISSSSRMSRGVFSSLQSQARSSNYHLCVCVCVQRACAHMTQIINLLSSLRRSHATIVLLFGGHVSCLLHGFVAKKDCLVLWLSKPALLSNH